MCSSKVHDVSLSRNDQNLSSFARDTFVHDASVHDKCDDHFFREILHAAGVEVNGRRPWDIRIHNTEIYRMVAANGSVGLGETYVQGMWDCDALDEFINRCARQSMAKMLNFSQVETQLVYRLFNFQKVSRIFKILGRHYNFGNSLFESVLDKNMVYSCGYWKYANNLDWAQEEKINVVAKKLGLVPGMKVLDLGCGWGTVPRYLAQHYGVEIDGVTVSKEQAACAKKICEGLPVNVKVADCRSITGEYDRIYSIGMFEYVGHKNYKAYMNVAHRCLRKNGIFLLHAIGKHEFITVPDPWVNRYIFPNGLIPSQTHVIDAIGDKFVVKDWLNFGPHYDKTLMSWLKNFDDAWPELRNDYDEQFRRLWRYYLMYCAGSFRSGVNQLWQIVLASE